MQKVLHVLLEHHEAKPLLSGEAFPLDTHGIEHVVLQVERKRYAKRHTVEVLENDSRKLLAHMPSQRAKTAHCRFCKEPMVPQGLWKHEKYCPKKRKGTHA